MPERQPPSYLDPQDVRPDPSSPDPQIIMIDPADVRFAFLTDPRTGELDWVVMTDDRGETLVTWCVADETDDTILLTGPLAESAA
jgi:hypothetical protein